MGNYMNELIKRKRKELIATFGGHCECCGFPTYLEFAHVWETGLKGSGRGRKERYYDVYNNPLDYVLLCKSCHSLFDSGQLELKEFKHLTERTLAFISRVKALGQQPVEERSCLKRKTSKWTKRIEQHLRNTRKETPEK